MPRGYLRHNRAKNGVGRKAARGGSSRKADRIPGYIRDDNRYINRHMGKYLRKYLPSIVDDEINEGIDAYFEEERGMWDDDAEFEGSLEHNVEFYPSCDVSLCESKKEQSLDSSLVVACNDSRENNGSLVHDYNDASDISYEETDSFFDVESDVQRHNYITKSQWEQDYSLCDTSSQGSESFSLIRTPTSYKEDIMSASTALTPWEIVADTTIQDPKMSNSDQGVFDLHITCLGTTKNSEEDESISCISTTPMPDKVGRIYDVPPQLVVPQQCAICMCEKKDVLRLMHKCDHPEACMSCLRTLYVDSLIHKDPKGDDVSDLPLKCFWPGCHRTLRDVQIRSLVRNTEEMKLCYDRMARAKTSRAKKVARAKIHGRRLWNFKALQECSECSTTNPVYPVRAKKFSCANCTVIQKITVMSVEHVDSIVTAVGDMIANCPACETLIVKDGGCDDMTCFCGRTFSFSKAHEPFRKAGDARWSRLRPIWEIEWQNR
mmetsp:Transcript_20429/g.23567  ORF Transcript_20429/g.23567 Transcript_20429/m.23567 type:complete len:491 (-) Transcript_20429:103-1575(-)